ncbi:MAG: vanadium-dependent haloperoxidase [Saprospirales bacterium]|nr:vanadium-dependent haloperoxidase [Saprospirales bacterium]
MEVFTISRPLSRENKWIAEFWSDDIPGLTVSPAGRWIAIANQLFQLKQPFLPELLGAYLRLGLGLSDALTICWDKKYQYNLIRPEQYIRQFIQPGWRPLHENPSFPGYPSGHSAAGAVAAEILAATLGDVLKFTDRTHQNRKEFHGEPRTYNSFAEMANENAFSRVALGVHFRMDCEEGLRLGRSIGKRVLALPLNRDGVLAN